jgi:iron complex outermembrane receptor protein
MVLDTEKTWSETTWRAGLEWDAGPQSLLYVSAETGFKAGGFFFSHDDPTYDPEKITAYTLGSKNRLLDGRLQLNGEAFWWKYRDQQLSHLAVDSTGAFVFATENVGRAEMKGAELEAQFLARSNTLLAADVQYLNAVYENFVYRLPNLGAPPAVSCPFNGGAPPTAFVVNCSGKTPPQSPRWTVNLTLQQTFLLGNSGAIVADVHTHFQTKTLTGLEFLDLEYQDSYWMSGLSLGYKAPGERWSLSGYVENIEDKEVVQGTFPHPLAPLYAATLRPPRTYGVRLGVNF